MSSVGLAASPALASHPSARAIYSPSFDRTLLVAPVALGLAAAVAVLLDSRWWAPLLFADLWLLGYHHVVATYTRMAFDTKTFTRHRFLAFDLLLIVVVGTVTAALTAGAWVVATAFLYLQWFHYMRQGYGIARMYFRSTPEGQVAGAKDLLTDAVIYLVPIYGIAFRTSRIDGTFLDLPVKVLALPNQLVAALGAVAAMAVAAWLIRTARDAVRGTLAPSYAAFVASHIAVFVVGYVAIDNVNTGWLAVNIWHNLQYVLVVWMSNAKRFAGGIDPQARFLSRLSQPGRVVSYFGCCVAISTFVYLGLGSASAMVLGGGIGATIGIYMGINFHHYIVDSVIWHRRRAAAVQA